MHCESIYYFLILDCDTVECALTITNCNTRTAWTDVSSHHLLRDTAFLK